MIDRQLIIVRRMSCPPREAAVQLRRRPHLSDRHIGIMYDLAAVIAIVVQQQFVRLRRAAIRMQGKLMRIRRIEFPFRRIELQLRSGGSTLDERHPPPHILRVRRQICCSGRNIIQRDTVSCRVESPCIHDREHTVPIMDVRAKVKVVRREVIHGLYLCILCVDDELVVLCRCTTFRTDQLCSIKMRIVQITMSFVAEIHTIVRDDTSARRRTGNDLAPDGAARERNRVARHIAAARCSPAIDCRRLCGSADGAA